MSLLTSAELSSMRTELDKTLPDTCVIQTYSTAADGEGGWTKTYAAVSGGTVSCRLDPLTTSEKDMVFADADTLRVHYRLTVPYDAPLEENARIVSGGNNYEVIQMDKDNSWRLDRRAIIAELRT